MLTQSVVSKIEHFFFDRYLAYGFRGAMPISLKVLCFFTFEKTLLFSVVGPFKSGKIMRKEGHSIFLHSVACSLPSRRFRTKRVLIIVLFILVKIVFTFVLPFYKPLKWKKQRKIWVWVRPLPSFGNFPHIFFSCPGQLYR